MERPVVLGIDFGGSKIAVAVADAAGVQLGSDAIQVRREDPAPATFARGIALAHALVAEHAPGATVAAVGASTFGIPHEDRVDLAPTVPGWEQLAFGAELRRAFPGARIRTATDVKAAAQAELDSGALAGCDPGLYLNLGTGLAVAIVVGGAVVSGRNGAAGEIGYALRHPDASVTAPRLEEEVSGGALAAAARRLLGGPDVEALLRQADVLPEAAAIRDRFVAELCFHLANLTIALDPERVVVGGGLVRSWALFGPRLAAALRARTPFAPDIVVAAHPFDAPLLGALALGHAALGGSSAAWDVISEGAPA